MVGHMLHNMESVDFLNVVQYPLNMLKFFGCIVPTILKIKSEDGKAASVSENVCSVCVLLYRTVFCALHLLNVARSLAFEVYAFQNFNTSMAFYIQWYVFLYFGSSAYVSEAIVARFYFRALVEMLRNYGLEFGFLGNLRRVKRITQCATLMLLVGCILINALLSTAFLFWITRDKPYFIYPFQRNEGVTYIIAGYVIMVTSVIIYQTMSGYFIIYSAFIEIVRMEFEAASKEMRDALQCESMQHDKEAAFFRIRDRHRMLTNIVRQLCLLTRFFAILSLLYTLAVVMFVLYALGSGRLSNEETAAEITFLFIGVLLLFFICVKWGSLPGSANAITEAIRTSSLNTASPEFLQQVQLFLTEVAQSKAGIDLFGLFTIDSSTVLMILGTVLTYGIIVIQTQQDTSDRCQCTCNSTTCV